ARSPISRRIQRMTKRCTRRSISSAASKRTRPTLRTPRRRFRTRGRAIAHGIQPRPKADATRLSTGSVLRPRNDLSLMWVSGHIAGWIKQYKSWTSNCHVSVGGLELRNVVAKSPFETSHRFPEILHSMFQPREERCNLTLELQTPLLEPCENLVGGRPFPRL